MVGQLIEGCEASALRGRTKKKGSAAARFEEEEQETPPLPSSSFSLLALSLLPSLPSPPLHSTNLTVLALVRAPQDRGVLQDAERVQVEKILKIKEKKRKKSIRPFVCLSFSFFFLALCSAPAFSRSPSARGVEHREELGLDGGNRRERARTRRSEAPIVALEAVSPLSFLRFFFFRPRPRPPRPREPKHQHHPPYHHHRFFLFRTLPPTAISSRETRERESYLVPPVL